MTPTIALPSVFKETVLSLASGESPEAVLDKLMQKGLPEEFARDLMASAYRETLRTPADSMGHERSPRNLST